MKFKIRVFQGYEGCEKISEIIDIIICLGGDGTLLYASSLFKRSIPPIMSFNLGSLGFLTPFNFCEFHENLESLFRGNMHVLMRTRLEAIVVDREQPEEGDRLSWKIIIFSRIHWFTNRVQNFIIIGLSPTRHTQFLAQN